MKDLAKDLAKALAAISALILVSYYGWQFERWAHYKFSYQSQVQTELAPLVQRIDSLERRVSALETNKNVR